MASQSGGGADPAAQAVAGGRYWLRVGVGVVGLGLGVALGFIGAFVLALGCTDCDRGERNLAGILALVAFSAGVGLGVASVITALRGWRPWLVWAAISAVVLVAAVSSIGP